jgi:tetratricopeptide (TPR) repeat protein
VAVYVTRPGPDEGLFQRYFEPYPSTRPVVRGTPPGATATTDAMALYEARDYRGALAAFEVRLEGESPDSHVLFYAGLSRLALGEAEEATLALEKVLRLGPSELKAPAEWYLALVHLRAHHLGETRSRLEHIVQTGGFYQDKARGLLSALNRLEPGK